MKTNAQLLKENEALKLQLKQIRMQNEKRTKCISTKIKPSFWETVTLFANKNDVSIGRLIEVALKEYIQVHSY